MAYAGVFVPTTSIISGVSSVLNIKSYYQAVSPVAGNFCNVAYSLLVYCTAQSAAFRISAPFGGNFVDTSRAIFQGGNIYVSTSPTTDIGGTGFRSVIASPTTGLTSPRFDVNLNVDAALFTLGLALNFSLLYEID